MLIGAGKMGGAMLEGWLAQAAAEKGGGAGAAAGQGDQGARPARLRINPKGKIGNVAALVIAVKPQAAPEALAPLAAWWVPRPSCLDHPARVGSYRPQPAAARDLGDAARLRLRVGGRRLSNAPERETVVLLPLDPDASAERLRERLRELTGAEVGVIVSDSFGRAWRQGTTDVAIGAAGVRPLLDLKGTRDRVGYELHATVIAVADELAGAAELVLGKTDEVPAAVIRGVDARGEGTASELVMPAERDLFR